MISLVTRGYIADTSQIVTGNAVCKDDAKIYAMEDSTTVVPNESSVNLSSSEDQSSVLSSEQETTVTSEEDVANIRTTTCE